MITKTLAVLLLASQAIAPAQVAANSQRGYAQQCFKAEYREEYIPGTQNRPGRVRRWTEQVEVRCGTPGAVVHTRDNNSCLEGSIIGGILGGALGGTLSTQENWIWSIPSGVAAGAVVGCEIDGG